MSRKNERYFKVHGVALHGKYPGVDGVDPKSRYVALGGVQGQEVTMKKKKTSAPIKSMPKKKQNERQFPIIKKITKKERLANIRVRLISLKYVYKWQQKTFGRVSPSKARHHYNRKLLKRLFQQWEDVWWNGRNEWKLNIRADYHNRFRMWLKVWKGWRSYLTYERIKTEKMNLANQKANQMLLKKSIMNWKSYVSKRREKKQLYCQAEEDAEIIVKRMVFSKWKNSLKVRQELHSMEEQALHFWAHNLFYKAWQRWLHSYSTALDEKRQTLYAIQLHNRKLAFKVLRSFKLYRLQRNVKKLRLSSGMRFYRLHKMRDAFLKWRIIWERKVELFQFEDTVKCKGNNARKQRVFIHWKHYIVLCHRRRENECIAMNHFEMTLKTKCIRAFQTRVEIKRRAALFNLTAEKFYKVSLMKKFWISWLRSCDQREDLRQMSSINFVQNHYRKCLLRKMLNLWRRYCELRRLEHEQKFKADITARRNMLPKYFSRWEEFVDLVKSQRINQRRAEEFRRECLLAKTFYRWLQEHHLTLDVQMLHRMAIISYDEKLRKEFFHVWLTRTRLRIKENRLMGRSQDHYQRQLKKKCFVSWREYIKHLNFGFLQSKMAVRHQNRKLMLMCWENWTKFVIKKREKWRMLIKADLHFNRKILGKIVGSWKIYCEEWRAVKSFVEEKKVFHDQTTLRLRFECWRENAGCLRKSKEHYQISFRHWKSKIITRIFSAWQSYAEDRSWKRQQAFRRIVEAKRHLERGKLCRAFCQWKKEYRFKVSSNEKWMIAAEHWKRNVLKHSFDVLKKYRFLGYRKQVLRQQCMLYHNERIIALHWKVWRSKYAERKKFLKKSHMALWMWSFCLQRKAFVAWFHYVEEKKRKKIAINEALTRRRQRLHKVTVIHWIKFATYFMAERERFAATRHIQLSQNVQRCVQKCAIHWRRRTVRNRGKRRQITSLNRPIATSFDKNITTVKEVHARTSVPDIAPVKRPQPRVPEYLRESFNLSELSEHPPSSTVAEDIPRKLPQNLQPFIQPERLPEPPAYSSSVTSRTSSNTSQTGSDEVSRPLNSQKISKKADGSKSKKPVLLPPSSFEQTKSKKREEKIPSQELKETCGIRKCKGKVKLESSRPQINGNSKSGVIPSFLTDKNSQQSIVQLRNRMLKYYTITTQLRDSGRKLERLRHWSRHVKENGQGLNEEERMLVDDIINELSENVKTTSHNLEESYKTIANDLEKLLDKVS
ncbi:protein SFI1 homolog [Dendronephthya gigantea]|uniref:protein SFI1 homolog n=1 Tax=Dendronephthya gigantea TaxID=151771 RepID=UPI00106BEFA3|nr:protein SFI1 homolog [Dendronephthya gigantea]